MFLNDFDKVLLIISTASRNYRKVYKKIKLKLNSYMSRDKLIVKFTKNLNSNREYTNEFINKHTNALIIICGGDGSINEVAETIYFSKRKDIFFSFIPNGTGNDFSRYVYPKMNLKDIISNMGKIEKTNIDLIKINDKICVNSMAFGFESIILESSLRFKEKFPLLKKISYYMGIFMSLTKLKTIEYKYNIKYSDGTVKSGKIKSILNSLNNGKYYGGGFTPSPNANINDNIIDYNYIEYINIFKLVSLIPKYKNGEHVNLDISNNKKIISGRIFVEDEKEIVGNIDGNLYNFNKLEFKILPQAINLIKFIGNN